VGDDRRVIPVLGYAILAAGLVLALWTGIQVVIALIQLFGGHDVAEPVTFVAYSIGVLLALPLGFYLAREERTRWGSVCLCFTAVVVAVMMLRLLQLWQAPVG
jgi:hypothetical protein